MFEVYVSPMPELYHHGIKGQKWGVRRFQNPDGSLTEEGRRRYLKGKSLYNYESKATKRYEKKYGKNSEAYRKSAELDDKIAGQYRNDVGLKSFGKNLLLGSHTARKTYEMSRATGRGVVESFVRSKLDISPSALLSMATGLATGYAVSAGATAIELVKSGSTVSEALRMAAPTSLKQFLTKSIVPNATATADDIARANKVATAGMNLEAVNLTRQPKYGLDKAGMIISEGGSSKSLVAKRMAQDASQILAKDPERLAETISTMKGARRDPVLQEAFDTTKSALNIKNAARKQGVSVDKYINGMVGRAAGAGAAAGGIAGGVVDYGLNKRGSEMSAQQAWIRNNYVTKGSVQQQHEDREKRRLAKKSK